MSAEPRRVELTGDEIRALLEAWKIEENVPTDAFGATPEGMDAAADALDGAVHKLRDALAGSGDGLERAVRAYLDDPGEGALQSLRAALGE